MNSKKENILLTLLIILFWGIVHYSLLSTDVLLIRDDLMLIRAVDSVQSITDYFNKLLGGQLYDLQPVRDFTFWLNIKMVSMTGYGGFHLTNLILGLLILIKLKAILLKQTSYRLVVNGIILLLAVHPLLNTIMAWTSNRKHLLSIFLILCFIANWLDKKQVTWKGFFYLILSLLSQPITVFIPLIIIGHDYWKTRKISSPQVGAFCTAIFVLVANYWFYKNATVFTGRNAMEILRNDIAGDWILNLGRVLPQLVLPLSYGIEYDPGNILSLVGLILTLGFLLFIYKYQMKNKSFLLFFLIGLSTLFPVFKWGPRDPYLLMSLLILIPSLGFYLSVHGNKKLKWIYPLIIIVFSYQSWRVTQAWGSDLSLTKFSYENEGGLENQMKYAIALNLIYPKKSYIVFADIKDKYPNVFQFNFLPLLAESYYFSDHMNAIEKMNEYLNYGGEDKYYLFFRGKFMEENNNLEEAQQSFKKLRQLLNSEVNQKAEFRAFICQKYRTECSEQFL